MFVQPLINTDSDQLCGIFWMTSDQILLWSRYSDVILHDNTSRTNKYNFPLSLFILVDNDGKSRLGAQVFLNVGFAADVRCDWLTTSSNINRYGFCYDCSVSNYI